MIEKLTAYDLRTSSHILHVRLKVHYGDVESILKVNISNRWFYDLRNALKNVIVLFWLVGIAVPNKEVESITKVNI